MTAPEIDEQLRLFRARVKARKIKQWNKNVWAVETEAEKFIIDLLVYVPSGTQFATRSATEPTPPPNKTGDSTPSAI